MSYNFLRSARKISNSNDCVYDSIDAFSTNFQTNGNVDGWTTYYNIYFYGCWGGVLFGTAADRSCYINRADNFLPIAAEDYYYVKLMMKITDNNPNKVYDSLTTGKLQWVTLTDSVWNDDKSLEFDIIADDQWHLYVINVGPAKYWISDISNIRVFPFTDGWEGDQFAIKYIKISSDSKFTCRNTACSYHINYEHNCPGAGSRGYAEAGTSKSFYSTTLGDLLTISIDGYGETSFHLGTHINLDVYEMMNLIGSKLSSLSIGGYCYASIELSDNDTIKIISGTAGASSSVTVSNTPLAIELGFYDSAGNYIGTTNTGSDPATGFEYASSRLLTTAEIGRLRDGNTDIIGYTHNAQQYNVEGGRSDYNEIGFIARTSDLDDTTRGSLSNRGKTIIDWSHPFNNNGKVNNIYVYAEKFENSKILVCRPYSDGTLRVIHTLSFADTSNDFLTRYNDVHQIECDILVNKGDVLAVYDAEVSIGTSITGNPDATYSQVSGLPAGNFDPGTAFSEGVGGLAIYARSNRYQTSTLLDIDFGDRLNIEECNLYGSELSEYFEYNIAMCLDVNWKVNLYGRNHKHTVSNGVDTWTVTHNNVAYGIAALSDGKIVAENGVAGQSTSNDSTGLITSGDHSYFYVNGDAEWLQPNEFSPTLTVNVYDFTEDPINLQLDFPTDKYCKVHKSIIYFKERNNFRDFALYYGLGKYSVGGNYIDTQHKLIPSYNYVSMDGIVYNETNNESVEAYIFENPCTIDVTHDITGYMIETDRFFAANACDWTVLEHGFDPVDCYDFNIYCDYHNSTKITEIEVYSKMYIEPSMIDNISLQYSAYGTIWKDAIFESLETAKVSAFIGGSPRYMKLELQTTNIFNLNEIELLAGDQVKTTNCDALILLDDAKRNVVNASKRFSIQNIYDRPFTLKVDLPKDTFSTRGALYWSKLDSMDDIDSPDLGPAAILRKAEDKSLVTSDNQCAINVPCYGLNNLIGGKEAYYSNNGADWASYGTLTSGTSVSFDISNYINTVNTTITFPAVSSTYWNLYLVDSNEGTFIKDIIAYYGDTRVLLEAVYFNETPPLPMTLPNSSDGTALSETPAECVLALNETFTGVDGTVANPAYWTSNGYFKLNGNTLLVRATGSSTNYTYIKSNFILQGDFDIQCDYLNEYINDTTSIFDFRITTAVAGDGYATIGPAKYSVYSRFLARIVPPGGTTIETWPSRTDNVPGKLRIVRVGSTITLYYTYTTGWTQALTGTFCDQDVELWLGLYKSNTSYDPYISIDNIILNSGTARLKTFVPTRGIGFKTVNNEPLDKLVLIHNTINIAEVLLYLSNNNSTYFSWKTSTSYDIALNDHHVLFAIDLLQRHSLAIIRNYGYLTDKLFISVSDNVDYSNSTTSNINLVDFNNSSADDCRWARINIPTADLTNYTLDKLGIYPNIEVAYCAGGGYNCFWTSLGTTLSDYKHPLNVAYGSEVTASTYTAYMTPDKLVDGNYNPVSMAECWAFEGDSPYVDLLFDALYSINNIKLFHSFSATDTYFMNTEYTISLSTTTSGENFIELLSVTGNDRLETTHYFTTTPARRLRLTIDAYTSTPISLDDGTTFEGSFMREIEVYSSSAVESVDSETWPVVCINLKDHFTIATHELISSNPNDLTISWDNDDAFFRYSDSTQSDPKKVSFNLTGSNTVLYNTLESSGDQTGYWEYTFDEDIYLDAGSYLISFQAYDLDPGDDKMGIRLEGIINIDVFAEVEGPSNWTDQQQAFEVPEPGHFMVKGKQFTSYEYTWGIRYITIYRTSSYSQWVAVTRDTATDYAYNGIDKGIDTLNTIKLYGIIPYITTNYSWWWSSTTSTLTNDWLIVRNNGPSLRIAYPASTAEDIITFIPGSDFGTDPYWSIKDLLSFDLYVEDITKLDLTTADITFGIIGSSGETYYRWSLTDEGLTTGWNSVRLKFESATGVYPEETEYFYSYMDDKLNFASREEGFNYFMLRYKGVGDVTNLYLTSLNIERNSFDEPAHFGNGLYLNGLDFLQIPVSGLTLTKGTIEFWLRTYYDSYGRDIFNNIASRTLFSIVNNANNIISLGIKSGHWFELTAGHSRKSINIVDATTEVALTGFFDIDTSMHIAVVWSNDGTAMSNDDTLRFYINNRLIYSMKTTWSIEDTKDTIVRLSGGNSPIAYNYDSPSGGGIFDNIKIYDDCKEFFNIEQEDITNAMFYDPNNYVEISKDNINFYNSSSELLPLVFEQVPSGETRSIYIRANKTVDGFTNSAKSADLLVYWLTTV